MSAIKRKTDQQGRVTLGREFANQIVCVEYVGPGEVRIRSKRHRIRRFTLEQLLAHVTPEKRHPETDTGEAVGNELI